MPIGFAFTNHFILKQCWRMHAYNILFEQPEIRYIVSAFVYQNHLCIVIYAKGFCAFCRIQRIARWVIPAGGMIHWS